MSDVFAKALAVRSEHPFQGVFKKVMQFHARQEFLISTTSPASPRGRGKQRRPLILGPVCMAMSHSFADAVDDLVHQARRFDCNTLYGFTMQQSRESNWIVMGTPAISEIPLVRV